MSELKACPFCGGEAYDYVGSEFIGCQNNGCMAESRVGYNDMLGWSRAGAIEAWNSRPLEAALEARIAELETANLELQKSLVDVTHKYILATEAADADGGEGVDPVGVISRLVEEAGLVFDGNEPVWNDVPDDDQ